MKLLSLVAAVLMMTAIANPLAAQNPQCNERDSVLELLAKKYQESPTAIGVTNTGGLIEILTSAKTSTWTIIITTPQGMSCLVAAGEGWRNLEQINAPEGPVI